MVGLWPQRRLALHVFVQPRWLLCTCVCICFPVGSIHINEMSGCLLARNGAEGTTVPLCSMVLWRSQLSRKPRSSGSHNSGTVTDRPVQWEWDRLANGGLSVPLHPRRL